MTYDDKNITYGETKGSVFTLVVSQKEAFEDRLKEFRKKLQNARNEYDDCFNIVISKRSRVFDDTFRQFLSCSNIEKQLKSTMYVRFNNEAGIDCGGVRR